MPSYTMKHNETGETREMILSFAEREKFLEDNPDWKQCLATAKIVSGVGSNLSKTDGGWKDVLNKIKSGSAKSNTIDDG